MPIAAIIALAAFTATPAAEVRKQVPSATTANPDVQRQASPTTTDPASGEDIKWQVISSGGTDGSSTTFRLLGTVGQPAVGYGSSTGFGLSHGFWQEFGPSICCNGDGIRGNADGQTGVGGEIDVADLTYLVAYLFQGGPAPPCMDEGNVDGIIGAGGPVDVADLTQLVAYLFAGGPPPAAC